MIEGMCGHYKLDKAILSLPKKEAPAKEQRKKQLPAKKKVNKKTTKNAPKKGKPSTDTGTTEPPPPER